MVVTDTPSWVISLVLMSIQTSKSAEGVTRTWFCEVHQVGSWLSRGPWKEENWGPWAAWAKAGLHQHSLVSALGSGCFLGHGHYLLRWGKTEKHGRLAELWDIQNDVGLRQENCSLAAADQILWQQRWALSTEPICTDSASLKCKYHPHWGL